MPGVRIKGASSNLCLSFSSQCEWDQWLLNTREASALSCYATNARVYVLRKLFGARGKRRGEGEEASPLINRPRVDKGNDATRFCHLPIKGPRQNVGGAETYESINWLLFVPNHMQRRLVELGTIWKNQPKTSTPSTSCESDQEETSSRPRMWLWSVGGKKRVSVYGLHLWFLLRWPGSLEGPSWRTSRIHGNQMGRSSLWPISWLHHSRYLLLANPGSEVFIALS